MEKKILIIERDLNQLMTLNFIEGHSLRFVKKNGYWPTVVILPFDLYCEMAHNVCFNPGRKLDMSTHLRLSCMQVNISGNLIKIIPVQNHKVIEFH